MRRTLRVAVGRQYLVGLWPDGQVRYSGAETPAAAAASILAWAAEVSAKRVEWTLLPPLVDVRLIRLPRLRQREIGTVLTRNVSKYFPAAKSAQVIGWQIVKRERGALDDLLVGAAPEDVINEIRGSLEAAGLVVGAPSPAHVGWVAAADVRGRQRRQGVLGVELHDRAYLLAFRGLQLTATSVLPASPDDRRAARARELSQGGPVLELAPRQAPIAGAEDVLPFDPRSRAAVLAAVHFASRENPLRLFTASERASRRRRNRLRATWTASAAAVLVLLAGALELWGLQRELRAISAEREEIAAAVSLALERRQTLETLRSQITAVDSLERSAPTWAGLITELSTRLPRTAHLSVLRGTVDSLTVNGAARNPEEAIDSIRGLYGVAALHSLQPSRRERSESALQLFSVRLQLTGPAAGGIPGGTPR